MNTEEEVKQLAQEIKRLGTLNDKQQYVVKFGVIVKDDRCCNLFEALNGTLRSAKKRKIIDFKGEMLLQGAHDNVDIVLL
jgi:hypothetical protein